MKTSQLSEIWIYPVKSLGGISIPSARVMPKGLQYDRRWMLVDTEGKFLTQRQYPVFSKFKTAIEGDQLLIRYLVDRLSIDIKEENKTCLDVRIWDDVVQAYEVSPFHSQWFSDRIGTDCKLVYFPENNPRAVDPRYSIHDDHTSLSDAYPFLLIGQASLDELNKRLAIPLPIDRFRPNFVFTGGHPHEEDDWKNFTIGDGKFSAVKPCARCIIPTINQDTGEKGVEPLKTLAAYRSRNNKIYFGQNVISLSAHTVSVGDLITVL